MAQGQDSYHRPEIKNSQLFEENFPTFFPRQNATPPAIDFNFGDHDPLLITKPSTFCPTVHLSVEFYNTLDSVDQKRLWFDPTKKHLSRGDIQHTTATHGCRRCVLEIKDFEQHGAMLPGWIFSAEKHFYRKVWSQVQWQAEIPCLKKSQGSPIEYALHWSASAACCHPWRNSCSRSKWHPHHHHRECSACLIWSHAK